MRRGIWWFVILIYFCGLLAAQAPPLAVVDEPLPPLEVGVEFHFFLHAMGGAPPYVWSVAGGDLPEGIQFTPDGLLHGRPTKPGAFALDLQAEDSGHPAHTVSKAFRATVAAPLLLEWSDPPKVRDSRIDGAVQVSNNSADTFDLTFIVEAVAEDGRATAIGYEHFNLKPGTTNFKILFGSTLPHGIYAINADAIAEIPSRNAILRQRLQTPQPLQVTQGP